jgi:cell division protein FtsN
MEDVKKPVKQKEVSKTNSKIQTPSASKNAGQNESEKMKDPLKEKETVTQHDTKQTKAGDQDKQSVKQKFIIQVASLKDKSTAYKMNKEIASMGFQPKIIKTEIKGKGIVYRVVVSDIKNKEHAQNAAKKISAKTKSNCMIKKIEIKTKEN